MTTSASKINRMKKILQDRLQEQASRLLLQRLEARLQDADDSPAALRESIEAIRTAVRMFVDERLADEIHKRLMVEAGLTNGR